MKILICIIFLVGCGMEPSGSYKEPAPTDPQPPSGTVTFAQAKVVIDEQCASCHEGAAFIQTGPAFKASTSRQRINSGNMPKKSGRNYPIYNNAKKKILLDYLTS